MCRDADASGLNVTGGGEDVGNVGRMDVREERCPDHVARLIAENVDDPVAHMSHAPLIVGPSDDK
jgi:hypothetical protein